jgi:hypothetical protein
MIVLQRMRTETRALIFQSIAGCLLYNLRDIDHRIQWFVFWEICGNWDVSWYIGVLLEKVPVQRAMAQQPETTFFA